MVATTTRTVTKLNAATKKETFILLLLVLLIVRDGANFTVQLVVVYEIILVCRKQLSFLSFRVDVKKYISIGLYVKLILCVLYSLVNILILTKRLLLEPVPF